MTVKIKFRPGGPLTVQGSFELVDADGNPVDLGERKVVAFCRCGASRSQPFCDGSHNRIPSPSSDPEPSQE